MQITVSGKHIDIGKALTKYIEDDLNNVVKKYFENAVKSDVIISKSRHFFRTDIVVNEGTGNNVVIKSNAEDDDVYASFDIASAKIEKQLRRYKERLKNHHNERLKELDINSMDARKYVISSSEQESKTSDEDAPLIIAEKQTVIERLSVSDAVMRMDLGNLPAVLFINKKTDAVNVVYRREDGNISWIDSGIMTVTSNAKILKSKAKPVAKKTVSKAKPVKKPAAKKTTAKKVVKKAVKKPAKVAKKKR